MKLIKNLVIVKLEKGYLGINSLNGRTDLVSEGAIEIIKRWRNEENIVPANADEAALFSNLNDRGYLCNNDVEEKRKKDEIVAVLRDKYKKERAK